MGNQQKKRILVVDDEPIIRLTAEDLLNVLGYEVLLAKDSQECFKITRTDNNIDLIILDMNMPIINGKECFFELQKINPRMKVLFSSGLLTDEDELLSFNNVVGVINKPYTMEEMNKKLKIAFNSIQ